MWTTTGKVLFYQTVIKTGLHSKNDFCGATYSMVSLHYVVHKSTNQKQKLVHVHDVMDLTQVYVWLNKEKDWFPLDNIYVDWS